MIGAIQCGLAGFRHFIDFASKHFTWGIQCKPRVVMFVVIPVKHAAKPGFGVFGGLESGREIGLVFACLK